MQKTIIESVKHALGAGMLQRKGEVIYSSIETLTPGKFYLLGFNPGGDENEGDSIEQDLDISLNRKTNNYLDVMWWDERESPFQIRLRKLFDNIGTDLRTIFSLNLVFARSHDVSQINYPLDADICWKAHEIFLDTVNPTVIFSIGNGEKSAYTYLKNRFGSTYEEETIPAHHGNYKCKYFECTLLAQQVQIIGLPHFSYYDPNKPAILDWLKSKINI